MLHIHHYIVGLRHLAVEIQAAAHRAHLTVTPHELVLGNEHRIIAFSEILSLDIIVVTFRHYRLHSLVQGLFGILGELRFHGLLLGYEPVYGVRIDTGEAAVLQLGLEQVHEVGIELAVQKEHVVALVLCGLDEAVLGLGVGSIEIDQLAVLVLLLCLYGLAVVLDAEVLAVGILEQAELHRPVAELLVAEHTVL